jgi:hypothetical protein
LRIPIDLTSAYAAELACEGILARRQKELEVQCRRERPSRIRREGGHEADPRANLSGTGALLERAPVLLRAPVLGLENYGSLFLWFAGGDHFVVGFAAGEAAFFGG